MTISERLFSELERRNLTAYALCQTLGITDRVLRENTSNSRVGASDRLVFFPIFILITTEGLML